MSKINYANGQPAFVSIRRQVEFGGPAKYSVDISPERYAGGYCRITSYIREVFDIIEDETKVNLSKELQDEIEHFSFHLGDWKSWA